MLPSETHWPTNLVLTHCKQYCQKYQKLKFCLCWAWYYCYFQIYQFKSGFQSFLTTIVGKLFEKTPIAYTLARNLTCLDPNLIVTDKEGCCAKFNVVLSKLVKCSRLNIRDCDPLVFSTLSFLIWQLRLRNQPSKNSTSRWTGWIYFCRNRLVLLVHCPNYGICWENSWFFLTQVKQLSREVFQ